MMRRLGHSVIAAMLACACSPKAPEAQGPLAAAPAACKAEGHPLAHDACDLKVDEMTMRVRFGNPPGAGTGRIEIDVLADDGTMLQTLTEDDLGEYDYPAARDFDGDGRTDVLITRQAGNANLDQGVWRQSVDGTFVRVGEIDGVGTSKTADGLVAAPARSSAAEWSVAFYHVDETGMLPIATIAVAAQGDGAGKAKSISCTLTDAPGIASLNLTRAEAEKKFCAEPAAGMFNE